MGKFAIFAVLLLMGSLFAADACFPQNWTYINGGVYWSEDNYTISAYPAVSNGIIEQTQYINFSSTNPASILVNMSFAFPQKPTAGDIQLWQNTSHNVVIVNNTRGNSSYFVANVVSYQPSNATCMLGNDQNLLKYNITYNGINGTEWGIACFNSYTNVSNNYTLYYTYNKTTYTNEVQYWMDWGSIIGSFDYTNISGYHIYTITDVPFNGSTNYQTKFKYSFPTPSIGKFNIYIHSGNPQSVINGTSQIYVQLDPWWNATYTKRMPINCSLMTTNTPLVINGSGGFYIDGLNQIVWTKCAPELYLYYINNQTYVVANNTTQFPMKVEFGNGTDYDPTSVWTDAKAIYHMANATDTMGAYNFTTNTGTQITGKIGKAENFSASQEASISSNLGITNGSLTFSIWINPFNSAAANWVPAHRQSDISDMMYGFVQNQYTSTPYAIHGWRASQGVADATAQSSVLLPNNVWVKMTQTWNVADGNYSLYRNGSYVSSVTSTTYGSGGGVDLLSLNNHDGIGWGGMTRYIDAFDQVEIFSAAKSPTYIAETYNNEMSVAGYGLLGTLENASSPINLTIFAQTATNFYNGTNVNYTITGIFYNPTASSQTVNIFLRANGTLLNSSNNTAIAGYALYNLSGTWSASRPTLDANFTINASATGDDITTSGTNSTTLTMLLPIDPPSAINLMANGGKTRCRTPQNVGYWDSRAWNINASWNCNYTNLNLTTQLTTGGIAIADSGTFSFSTCNITAIIRRLAGDTGTDAKYIFNSCTYRTG